MKNLKFTDLEVYLLEQALKGFKDLIDKEEFPPNSIVTKEFVREAVFEIERKITEA